MKKTLLLTTILLVSLLPLRGFLADKEETLPTIQISKAEDVVKLINNVAKWFYTIILALAVIFVLISAFTYLTSEGKAESIKKANKQLLYAVIAVIVAILAFSVKTIIYEVLTTK